MNDCEKGTAYGQPTSANRSRVVPMINGARVRPFRAMANYVNKPRSTSIGYFLLLASNTIFLILAVTFAILYFNTGSSNGIGAGDTPDKFAGGGTAMPEWNGSTRSLFGQYSAAAVAADNAICSAIGRNALLRGANAVDAAIATQFCIGVMDSHSSGLGGGLLMTIYNATTRRCHVIDGREVAPRNASEDMYTGRMDKAGRGWESVAVPGELHGFWTAYKQFGGSVEWRTLVEPTVELVQKGYPLSHAVAGYLKSKRKEVMGNAQMRATFTNPDTGELYAAGEQVTTRKNLADTLKQLAEANDPLELFYNGKMAKSMVDEFRENGGRLTEQDFADYRSKVRSESDVIYTELPGDFVACGPPPPSGSAVAMAILNILAPLHFNLSSFSGRVDFLHHFIEASKFAYAVRNSLGDMDFVPQAMEKAKMLTGTEWAQNIRSKITPETHEDAYYDDADSPPFYQEHHGTAHVSLVDRWGNVVSVTSSINEAFGSMVFSESTGILWNDQMDDFSTPGEPNFWGYPPSPHNFIRPGKRPMSSMSPIVIFNKNNKEVASFGGAGGSSIISGVAATAFNSLWLGMDIKEAIDFPRLHNQLRPNFTRTESRLPPEYRKALEQRGHRFEQIPSESFYFNVVTGVRRVENGTIYANSDWRKGWESQPAGY